MSKTGIRGVSPRGSSIRIIFTWNGKRYFPTLKMEPTPANLEYAADLRREILRRIKVGAFNFSEFFPESPNAKKTDRSLFSDVAAAWLDSKRRNLAETTIGEYLATIGAYFSGKLGGMAMEDIGYLELDKLMCSLDVSNKTFNNILSVLRCIYAYGVDAGIVTVNHALKIGFAKIDDPTPDPLTIEEMSLVIRDMQQHYHEQIAIYFNLAFRIGFRPSEGIDLRWQNVDWQEKILRISTAKVRGVVKTTKTNKARLVELDDDSMALLKRLHQITGNAEYLLIAPVTGKPYPNTSYLVQKYWRPALARCNIRDRDARQTRHTCATMLLMGGSRDRWAAEQLGHSVEMFQKVYSKWLPKNDRRQELAKASAMFARMSDQIN